MATTTLGAEIVAAIDALPPADKLDRAKVMDVMGDEIADHGYVDINIGKIKALDSNGLRIEDDGGNLGLFVKDGGNVGIGTSSPAAPLHVCVGASGATPHSYAKSILESDDAAMFTVLTPSTKAGYIGFGDNNDPWVAGLSYSHTNNILNFLANNATCMRLSTTGTVDRVDFGGGTGKTNLDVWLYLASDAAIWWDESDGSIIFNTAGSDLEFDLSNAACPFITANGTANMYFGVAASQGALYMTSGASYTGYRLSRIAPSSSALTLRYTLASGHATLFSYSSSIEHKRDVEELKDWKDSPSIMDVKPKKFRSLLPADDPEHEFVGFVLEDLAVIHPSLVTWGSDGIPNEAKSKRDPDYFEPGPLRPEAPDERTILALTVAEVQELRRELDEMRELIA